MSGAVVTLFCIRFWVVDTAGRILVVAEDNADRRGDAVERVVPVCMTPVMTIITELKHLISCVTRVKNPSYDQCTITISHSLPCGMELTMDIC